MGSVIICPQTNYQNMNNNIIRLNREYFQKVGMTLDNALQEIQIQEIDEYTNLSNDRGADLTGWFVVIDVSGIIAYFPEETMAAKYRLDLINQILNYE